AEALRIGLRIEMLHVGERTDRLLGHRPLRLLQRKRQPHRDRQRGDVVEEDDAIDAESSRQQRSLGRQLDVLGKFVEGQVAAQPGELRVPAARLTHRPDGWTFDRFTAGGANEQVVGWWRARLHARSSSTTLMISGPGYGFLPT